MPTKIKSMFSFQVRILQAKFYMIPCNRIRYKTTTRILGKTNQQRPLLSYICTNCSFVSDDAYFVYKFLCNFIHWKSRSSYPKNLRKSVTTASLAEWFSFLLLTSFYFKTQKIVNSSFMLEGLTTVFLFYFLLHTT